MAQAGWYPDPLARAQVRYWDGELWSPWVANDGASHVDAEASLVGLAAPSDAPAPTVSTAPSQYGWVQAPPQQFRPVNGLATALTWVLGAAIVAGVLLVAILFRRLRLETRYYHGNLSLVGDINRDGDRINGVAAALGLLDVAVLVLLIVYLYRAVKNTETWETARARWTPGWAIGGWFIPVANFVIPFLVVREVWRRSTQRGAGVLWGWWLAFVAGRLLILVDPGDATLHDVRVRDWSNIVGELLVVASAVCLILLVRRLATAQHDRSVTAPV
jgi:hypothetical protein